MLRAPSVARDARQNHNRTNNGHAWQPLQSFFQRGRVTRRRRICKRAASELVVRVRSKCRRASAQLSNDGRGNTG